MILPLLDKRYNKNVPVATYALVILNIIIFLSVHPGRLQYQVTVHKYGLSRVNLAFVPLVTHIFLHAHPLHILGNMLALWIFGRNLERLLGTAIFVPFYFACGLVAGLAQATLSGVDLPIIGASGAIYGIIAGYVIFFPRRKVKAVYLLSAFSNPESALLEISAWIYVVVFVLFQDVVLLAIGWGKDMIGHWAHFTGFSFGAGVTGLLRLMGFRGAPEEAAQGERPAYRFPARRLARVRRLRAALRKRQTEARQIHEPIEEDTTKPMAIILLDEKGLSPESLATLQRSFPKIAFCPQYVLASNLQEQDALALSRMLGRAGVRYFIMPQEYVIHLPRIYAVVAVEKSPENGLIFTEGSGSSLVRRLADTIMLCAARISPEDQAKQREKEVSPLYGGRPSALNTYVLDVYALNPWVCYRMIDHSSDMPPQSLCSAARVLSDTLPDIRGADNLRLFLSGQECSAKRFKTLDDYEHWATWQLQLTQLYRMKRRGRGM